MADDSQGSYQAAASVQIGVEERLAVGDAYVSTWWNGSDPMSVENAVIEYRAALAQCRPSDKSDWRFRARIGLSEALRVQFEEGLGRKESEEELFREALDLAESAVAGTAPLSSLHLQALSALGQVLYRWYHSKEHLQRATDTFRALVDQLSDSRGDLLISALALYSISLGKQFELQAKAPELLSLAKAAVDRAFTLIPDRDNAPYDLIHAESIIYAEQGHLTHDPSAIDEAIRVLRRMMDRISPTHPRVPFYWSLVALVYFRRYTLSGADEDLDGMVMAREQARNRTPRSHPRWASSIGNYAAALSERFRARGNLNDQRQVIELCRACLRDILSSPAGRTHLLDIWVNNFAETLSDTYSHTGDLELLDEAIGLHLDNLKRAPISRRAACLNSIALAYQLRFLAQGRLADLQRAASSAEQALECPLKGSLHAEVVYTLADILLAMHIESKDIAPLQKAVSFLQTSLLSEWVQPQVRGQLQSLLGMVLLSRAGILSSSDDIEESRQCQKRALELLPQEDPRQFLCYFRLGLAEFQSFVISHQPKGVDNSIAAFNRALSVMPIHHADRASYLSHLSKSLLATSDLGGSTAAFVEALDRLQEAATHSMSWPVDRYEAAIRWASVAHRSENHSQAIEAYRLAISLLPELASVRLEDELRVKHIGKQAQEIPQDAAACALALGKPELAVELLEAGRTLLWNARQELRADLARLREVAPDLATELAQTNAALDFRPPGESTATSLAESEAERRRVHRLVARRTELIAHIRSHFGFQQFLAPPTFNSLRYAAVNGPVVVLNASAYRCDAIIIQADEPVAVIPLYGVKHDQIKKEAMSLQYWLALATRDPKGRRFLEIVLQRLLDWLWRSIGSSICDALKGSRSGRELRRVWWCPTGAFSFLPIHACGPQSLNGVQLGMADIVISSYTPTISALLRAQKERLVASSVSRSLLVVSQPDAPGHVALPGAKEEMNIMEAIFPNTGTFLVGPAATLSTVGAALRDNGWFHVISHGTQNSLNPLESAVALYDGPLKLSDLAQANLPHAEFAFLSACHSAKGTTWIPDESMHLAAGMVFAGFRSVVATSWAIADKDAPVVTREFYKYLTQKSCPPLATDAAEALHSAVQALRKSGVTAQRWVPFIHLGA